MKLWRWISKEEREKRYQEILKLKSQGIPNVKIGQRFGIHGNRVGQILKESND